MTLEDRLLTESRNPASETIDRMSAIEIVDLMNTEDAKVAAAVHAARVEIAQAVDLAVACLKAGGRIIYVGAGTSGRLGVLDASECPPTFSVPPTMVVGLIAGGAPALTRAVEGAEDDPERGASDLRAIALDRNDLVVGIATSGRTPYVLGAVALARSLGAKTVGIACVKPSLLGERVDIEIAAITGPEVIAGSTRLKAGTATKLILNTITTGAMTLVGKTLGNRMVDLMPANEKLRIRSRRLLREIAGVEDARARELLAQSGGTLKVAIVMALLDLDREAAAALLSAHDGRIAHVLKAKGIEVPS